jgi:Holliday junction resolvasome RuvABC endonuclease subunit
MSAVCGMDPDTQRLAGGLVSNGRVLEVYSIPRTDSRGRVLATYDEALDAFARRLGAYGHTLYLESVFVGKNRLTGLALGEIQGEVKSAARKYGASVVSVKPSVWQGAMLRCTQPRDALKRLSRLVAMDALRKSRLPAQDLTEHEADGLCIALWGDAQERTGRYAEQAQLKFRRARP